MQLKDLIPNVLTQLQYFQLVSAKTGNTLTSVTYYECCSEDDRETIDYNMDSEVFGIAPAMTDNISKYKEPYIRIMLLNKENIYDET